MRRAVLLAASLVLAGSAVGAITTPNTTEPYLQLVTPNAATLVWESSGVITCTVDYGKTSAYGQTVSSPPTDYLHTVVLKGLDPLTRYHYRVTCGAEVGSDYSFRTGTLETRPFRFGVVGDTQSNPDVWESVAAGLALESPDLVLHVGDETSDGLDYAMWGTQFFYPAEELMASVPFYVAIGNHEKHSPYFTYYHAYPDPELRYTVSYANAFFIFLDTSNGIFPGSPKLKWLETQLSSNAAQSATWLFMVHHQPGYTEGWDPCEYTGDHYVRSFVIPLMEKYDVDMVFNGHTHGYSRGELNGVQYLISGGGGGGLDHACKDWPHISVAEYVHHYLTVDVDGGSLELQAHDPDGTIFDSVILEK